LPPFAISAPKRRTFHPIPELAVPSNVTKMMSQLHEPMEEIKSFMQDTRDMSNEAEPLSRSAFSLDL
jgi:hypothetical protein